MNSKIAALQLASFATFLFTVNAHTRLECPPPRSGETGAKIGPCDADDDLSLPAYPLVPGALNTITWLESLGHPGAPGRLALSLDGADEGFESCILLDHIPHDERSIPSLANQLSYHRASITVFIPDVYCERCHLQFVTVMSDEIHQLPKGEQCAYKGAQTAGTADANLEDCKVVYHSCSPVSINGKIPRDEYQCSLDSFIEELEWPFMQGKPPASTYAYKGDPGMYDRQIAVLQSGGKPVENCNNYFYCDPEKFYQENIVVEEGAKYAELHGTCAAMVNMVVEPFELGKLPSIPITTITNEMDSDTTMNKTKEIVEEIESTTSNTNNAAESSGIVALRTEVSFIMIGLLSLLVSTIIVA